MGQWKGLIIMTSMVLFILIITYGGPLGWQIVSGEHGKFATGTQIAGVSVEDMDQEEAAEKLEYQFSKWKKNHLIEIETQENTLRFQDSFLTLSTEASLHNSESGENTAAVIKVDRSHLDDFKKSTGKNISDNLLPEELVAQVETDASTLPENLPAYSVYEFLPPDVEALYETISTAEINIKDREQLAEFLDKLGSVSLEPGNSFSIIDTIESLPVSIDEEDEHRLATAVYTAVLNTNFSIDERQISQQLPDFADIGKEAAIDFDKSHDLSFTNPNEYTYDLVFSIIDNRLILEIRGYPLGSKVQTHTEEEKEIPSRTVVEYSVDLNEQEIKVEEEGQPGRSAVTTRVISDENGERTEKMGRDYYPPVNRIEVRSSLLKENTMDEEEMEEDFPASDSDPSSAERNDSDTDGPQSEVEETIEESNPSLEEDENRDEEKESGGIWENEDEVLYFK
ncbi:VanW family protein [Halobacillus sp. A1]|uniref:G5 domain-containing protein n=1 Tax=Halobacillus sp. A1 TaxID=2880262 RepID=UPI0020A622E8|nr:VanW family protein [Halobacillus sp. A1]